MTVADNEDPRFQEHMKWLAFVPHFQQERLARFLIRDIRALHYLEDLLRLFAQCT